MNLKKIISNTSYWTVNKHLAKEIGLEATLILQHLIDWGDYHNKTTIFQTYQQITEALYIALHTVKKVAIPKLKEKGFISVVRKGVGYKNHYTIHHQVIADFLTNPTSEVISTSPNSKVKTTSPIGEFDTTSEVNSTSLIGETTSAISKNVTIKNVAKENINKDNTSNSTERVRMGTIVYKSPSTQELNDWTHIK